MPIYEYAVKTGNRGCEKCAAGFEIIEKIHADPLTECPACGSPIERVISAPNVVAGQSHLLKESNFSDKGFTQYRKLEKGVYEKTAGKGPKIISDPDRP